MPWETSLEIFFQFVKIAIHEEGDFFNIYVFIYFYWLCIHFTIITSRTHFSGLLVSLCQHPLLNKDSCGFYQLYPILLTSQKMKLR